MKANLRKVLTDVTVTAATVAAALTFGAYAPGLYQKWEGDPHSGDFSEHVAGLPAKLTLYGTTTCPACIEARAYLNSAGIAFNDRVLEQSPEAEKLYERLGQRGVPILVANNRILVGFNGPAYTKLAASIVTR